MVQSVRRGGIPWHLKEDMKTTKLFVRPICSALPCDFEHRSEFKIDITYITLAWLSIEVKTVKRMVDHFKTFKRK